MEVGATDFYIDSENQYYTEMEVVADRL